jgi:hypothetical protein
MVKDGGIALDDLVELAIPPNLFALQIGWIKSKPSRSSGTLCFEAYVWVHPMTGAAN